jgi:alpha-L-rhamnosidase
LATAILFNQCPKGHTAEVVSTLSTAPPSMGESYPCNAGWRYWALAKAGRVDVVLKALRERWATMPSVLLNNTLQEDWAVQPDSGSQWSHCAVVPLYVLYMSVAGLTPIVPGFKRVEIRPQLSDLESLDLTARTVQGPIRFVSQGQFGSRQLALALPPGCEGELVLPTEEKVNLPRLGTPGAGRVRYLLAAGSSCQLTLAKT